MRRVLVVVWLLALALILTWRLRRHRPSAAETSRGPSLAAPTPMLVESSRALFSRPVAAGAPGGVAGVGPLPSSDRAGVESTQEYEGNEEATASGASGARAGLSMDLPSYGGSFAPSASAGPRPRGMEGAADGPAAGKEGAAAARAAARREAAAKTRAPGDARTAFDGTSRADGASPRAPGDSSAAGATPSATPGGTSAPVIDTLSRLGGGSVSAFPSGGLSGRSAGGSSGGGGGGGGIGAGAGTAAGSAMDALAGRPPGEGPAGAAPALEAHKAAPTQGEVRPEQMRPSTDLYATDRGKPFNIATGQVDRQGVKGAVVFEADMDIDADGAGGWHVADKTGQSHTSLRYPNGQSLNPGRLPFMVVPMDFSRTHPDVRLGDYGVISYRGRSVYAIVGDKGPNGVLGEASISAALSLGINAHPNTGGVDGGVRYVIFPGTADRVPPADAESIQLRGAQLLQEQGLPLR